MTTLMQASHQWATRPDDERFTNLLTMQKHFHDVREASTGSVVSTRRLQAVPLEDNKGMVMQIGNSDEGFAPTNWAFGQVVQLAEGRADYLRRLPSPLAADCINYGLRFMRDVEDVGVLTYQNGAPILRAATGPRYGRIWNVDIVDALVKHFGDGINGPTFRVPGEFGKKVDITKANTTLYGSDRDMFVFLADEEHRIEIPNRRNGESGSLARGFFTWNTETGGKSFGLGTFLFDYACSNRMVWGAMEYKEIVMRHTASAPDKFIEEITPALEMYAKSSTKSITAAIDAARGAKIEEDVTEFLAKRFGKRTVQSIEATHLLEEGRPIETLWDATTAVTAFARGIEHQDRRVDMERQAGELLSLASA